MNCSGTGRRFAVGAAAAGMVMLVCRTRTSLSLPCLTVPPTVV